MKKLTTKQIVTGGACLAIIILSQFFKNLSLYITGPIVNACLIIATLSLGPVIGIILSILTPLISFLITNSALIHAIVLILPAIMMGNIILCMVTYFVNRKVKKAFSLPLGMVLGSILKALFMGAVISNCLLVYFETPFPQVMIDAAKVSFSVTQLFTSLIGSAIAYIIWLSCRKVLLANNE